MDFLGKKKELSITFMRFSLFLILLIFINCSSTSKAYFKDRRKDLLDIISLQVGGGFGAGVQVSKISTGFGMFIYRTSNKPFFTFLVGQHKAKVFDYEYAWSTSVLGYSGKCSAKSKEKTYIDFYPTFLEHCESLKAMDEFTWEDFELRNKSYNEKTAYTRRYLDGKVEVTLGWVLGFNVQFNFYELADFFTGLVLIDLLEDDRHYKIANQTARDQLIYYIERGKRYYDQKKFALSLRDYRIVSRTRFRNITIQLVNQYRLKEPHHPFYLNVLSESYYRNKLYTNSKILSIEAIKYTKEPKFIEEIEKRSSRIYHKERKKLVPQNEPKDQNTR